MDKLQTINKSINEIREILGAECASIEQLPELVRAYVKDDSRNGFTTAFVFSSDLHPARPSGGSLDTTTGLVVSLDGNWSQTGISNGTAKIWMSFNIFDPSGNPILEEWTEPVNLKGDKGATGEQGEVGANGPMGPKGETGHSVSFRTVSVYTDTETLDTPSNPIGGFWNFTTNEVTPPTSETGVTWYLNADIPNRKKYLWLSQTTFDESGSILNDWCRPFRLTGEDGQDGVDGQVTEFIYRCLPNMKTYDALKLYLKDNKLESKNESEFIPETEDRIGGTEWSDSPTGITEALPIEVCCTRVRKSINDPWGPWSNCIIWAKWGEDGMDGDGVEYIYLVTEPRVNGEKITSEIIANPQFGYMPSRYEATLRADYQDDEFCFNEKWGYEGYEWTDEPSDVGPDQPLEWVSIRKKKNGVWGEFSDPQLWATFSEDGAAYLTSFVFTRAAIDNPPQRPAGGNIDNPMPILTPEWKDSVPMEFSDLPVWISKRTFKSGDDNWDDWNEPKILSDSPDFQVEYCAKQQRPSALTPFTGDEIAWRREQADVWGDDDTIVDPVWMATTIKKGGIWSPWVVTQIKGEKGDKGENGTSVSMKGKVATKQELLDAWDSYVNGGPFLSFNVDLIAGESIFVEEDGHLYIYSGGFYPGEDDVRFEKYWTSVLIQGEPGKNAYLYLAYTDELNPDVDIWIDPGHVAKYIGMFYSDEVYSKEALLDYNLYTWTRWSGEDGWGYEQIFLLTHKDLPYHPNGYHCPLPVKEEGDNTPGYLPHHPFANGAKPFEPETRWSDTPLSPDEEYPFCWVATRKVNGTEYSAWKGNTDRTASLYSRYTVDGVSGVYIELSNDYAFIPLEDGVIDPDFLKGVSEGTISPIKTVVRAYIGDEPVNSLQIGIEGEHIVVEGSTVFLNLDEIDSSITEIPLRVTVGDRTYDKSWKLFYTTTGYTISADSIVLKRGNMDGKLLDDILNVSITKWDGQKFINTGTPLFAKVYFDNGSEVQILSVEDGEISESDGGRAVVDLTKIANYPTKLHLYVVEPDADGNYRSDANEIAFQDVGVVFDGKNTFTINLTNDLGIIPLEEDGTIDAQAPNVTTTIQMYEGEELVPATYSVNINSNAISVNDAGNVIVKPALFENVENVPKEIICSATYRGITLTRIFKLNVTKNAYELFTDSNILPRDPYSGVLIDSDIKCELRRWNSVDNVYELPSNITDLYVHAECRHLDDEPCPDSSKNVANNARFNENGFATVDLRDEVNLIYFRLYVSAESTLEAAKNNWLTYEDIAVTADGSSSLHLELTNDFTMVPTDDQGNVDTNWDEEDDENQDLAISTAILYLGSTQIEGTYSWEIIDGTGTLEDANTNTCSLITMSTDSVTIRCTATCEVGSVSKDFNVVKSKGQPVYKLVPSANLFVYGKDNGGLIGPSKITFNVSKWTGFEYETVSNLSSEGVKITNSKNESISEVLPFRGDQEIYLKKSDNTLLDQETIGFVEGGSKGTDALHLELSNDFTMIATDDKGVPDVNWDEEDDEGQDLAYSEAKLYVGTVEASNATYSWEIISGEGTLEDADTDKCSLVTLTTDSATIRCTATYEGTSIWKDFNVIKSKGQPVYKLVSSANLFTYGKDGSNTATPSKITFSVNKWTGSQYETVSDLSTEGLTLTNASGISITEISPSKNNVTVYLKKGNVIIDQETIGYIEGGSKGSDALHLELSNDFTMVPTDSNGNVDTSWDEESDAGQDLAISTASLYLGVNKIDSSKVTWNWTIVEGTSAGTLEDATTDTCSVLTMNQDAITVRCTATYNGSSISKDLNVVKSKGQAVYKLVPSASVFAYNKAGVPNPSNITIKVLKWDNGSYSEVNAVTEGLTLSHTVLTAQKASQTVTLKKGGVILDQETVGYIESGADGVITDAEKERIEQAVRDAVLNTTQNNLNDAKIELSGKITAANTALETAKTNLQTAINNEKEARESGDTAAAEAAANALKEAQKAAADAAAYVKRLETVEGSITNLDSKIDTETGKIRDSVLTEEQVYELSIAALGSKAEVPEGSIAADSVFGQYFAGTVGVFGNLIADQVTATKISGALKDSDLQQLSIYSGTKYDDSAWALEKSGAGKIANGQISWNADGSEVKLGSNVKLTWGDNIDGKPSIPTDQDINNKIDNAIKSLDIPEGMTKQEVENVIKTTITGDYIATNNLIANVGKLNSALVGQWVFHKNYMFSQNGIDDEGYESSYSDWDDPADVIDDGTFIPNFCVNAVTGEFKANKGVLGNALLFKSGEITGSTTWGDTNGGVNFNNKQQWVLNSTYNYGSRYFGYGSNNLVAQVSVLNLGQPAVIRTTSITFVSGSGSGALVIPKDSLFQGMVYGNKKCFCPTNYVATKCSGGVDGTVTYMTPWENPGYAMSVKDYNGTKDVIDNTTSSTGTTLLDITVSCPKIVITYDTDSVIKQKTSSGGSNQRLFFTLNNTVATQRQYYINIYFYFNELCVGRYCVSGNAEIYND